MLALLRRLHDARKSGLPIEIFFFDDPDRLGSGRRDDGESSRKDFDGRSVECLEALDGLLSDGSFAVTVIPAELHCFYQGPGRSGGQFSILIEAPSPVEANAYFKRFGTTKGSTPPQGSGLLGLTDHRGKFVFSVSIRGGTRTSWTSSSPKRNATSSAQARRPVSSTSQ